MNTKSFLKASAIALSIVTIAGLPASPFTSTAHAAANTKQLGQSQDKKAIKVLEASIEALGGRKRLEAVDTITFTGDMKAPGMGINGSVTIYIDSPDTIRHIITIPSMGDVVTGINNGVAWNTSVMAGPRIVPNEEAKTLFNLLNSISNLLDFKTTYPTLEYVEEAEFDGQKAHKIRVIDKEGDEVIQYYSIEHGYQIGSMVEKVQTQMGEMSASTTLSNYKDFDGVLWATTLTEKAGMMEFVSTFSSISYDEIDASIFEVPAAVSALIKASAPADAPANTPADD